MATLTLDPTNIQAYLGVPDGLYRHKVAIDFLTGFLYYTDDITGIWTLITAGGGGGTSGSASLNFPEIEDGTIQELTFALAGAVVGDLVKPAWPATLTTGIIGMMFVSAADTITVRLLNMSGAPIDLGALTYGANVVAI